MYLVHDGKLIKKTQGLLSFLPAFFRSGLGWWVPLTVVFLDTPHPGQRVVSGGEFDWGGTSVKK